MLDDPIPHQNRQLVSEPDRTTVIHSSEVTRRVNQMESHFARVENCHLAIGHRQFSPHARRGINTRIRCNCAYSVRHVRQDEVSTRIHLINISRLASPELRTTRFDPHAAQNKHGMKRLGHWVGRLQKQY